MVQTINRVIKQRDYTWMPFAPERCRANGPVNMSVFLPPLPQPRISPYMIRAFDTTERRLIWPPQSIPPIRPMRAQMSGRLNPFVHPAHRGIRTTDRAMGGASNTSFNLRVPHRGRSL